jgi:hypothetical protein
MVLVPARLVALTPTACPDGTSDHARRVKDRARKFMSIVWLKINSPSKLGDTGADASNGLKSLEENPFFGLHSVAMPRART